MIIKALKLGGSVVTEASFQDGEKNVHPTHLRELNEVLPHPEWEQILQTAIKRRSTWKRMYTILNFMHYGLSILAITPTILIGVLPILFSYDKYSALYVIMSILATLFVFLLAFSSPSKQAKAYMGAWRHLDGAINRGELTKNESAIENLIASIDRGEEILSGKDPF